VVKRLSKIAVFFCWAYDSRSKVLIQQILCSVDRFFFKDSLILRLHEGGKAFRVSLPVFAGFMIESVVNTYI
jgi:hypothetical protein